jgi:signal transduction histidine kinase/CheY-like chemotaxis protein
MILSPARRAYLWAIGSLLLLVARCLVAAPLTVDLASATKISAAEATYACTTPLNFSFAKVLAGACSPELLDREALSQGFSDQAFWLRLTLKNPSQDPVRRWISVGHPRLEAVSLFAPDANGRWEQSDVGTSTPMSQRNEYSREFGVLPVSVSAKSQTTVWLRIASRTAIDLHVTFWKPSEYSKYAYQWNLGVGVAIGGLIVAAILSFMIYIAFRSPAYLWFGISILGAMLIELFRNGILQRYFWPAEWPMLTELSTVFALWTLTTFVLFFRSIFPKLNQYRWQHHVFFGMIGLTLIGQTWALFNYSAGTEFWTITLNASLLAGLLLLINVWRDGGRRAGYLLLSFLMIGVIEAMRLGVNLGVLPFYHGEMLAGPWALMLATPLVLLSIFERSRELENRLLKIEAENSAKLNFLSRMSHELRTPLNAILGYAELLERQSQRITTNEATHAIKQSGKYLLGMIDEILDHTRSITGKIKLDPAPVNLMTFLKEIERNTTLMCQPRGNRFTLQIVGKLPQAIQCDERRLRQILDNLLTNANRYTDHGEISLTCTVQGSHDTAIQLQFTISDTGVGIPPEEQETIFLPFSRGSAGITSGIEGSGIGLAVAQQLVRLMGGDIQLDSAPKQGSCFSFILEFQRAAIPQENGLDTGRFAAIKHALRLLIVDDDATSLHVLTTLLADQGFDIVTARSGAEANSFLGQKVDLVITDQFMANGDGWSVLAAWQPQDVPVFLLSAAQPTRPEKFPATLNFTGVLLKPVNAERLLTAVMDELGLPARNSFINKLKPFATQKKSAPPKPELLAPLLPMIEAGAVTDISEWAQSFGRQYPEHADYAATIQQATLNLDFEALHRLATLPEAAPLKA